MALDISRLLMAGAASAAGAYVILMIGFDQGPIITAGLSAIVGAAVLQVAMDTI